MSFLGGLFGAPNVEKMADQKDVKGLIRALSYQKDAHVRRAAARALGQIGDKAATPGLTDALEDQDSRVRGDAASALGLIGDSSAVPALVHALRSDGLDVSGHAAYALGKIGDAAAVPALIEALDYSKKPTRRAVANALGVIGGPDAVPVLIGLLNEGDWKPAVEALKQAGAAAVPALIEALGEGNDWVRPKAGRALEEIGAPAVPALIEALGHGNQRVRQYAARTLGKMRNAEAQNALRMLLEDEHEAVRKEAQRALDEIDGTSRMRPRVQETLQRGRTSVAARPDAEIRALLAALPVVREEPSACRQLRESHKDALASNTLGPVPVEEAVRQAAKVHPMGTARTTSDAVVVSFGGHAVDDGVAIWRTSEDQYRMLVWYDQVG